MNYFNTFYQEIKAKNNAGYTLVELLSVMMILVILTSVITGILFSITRGSRKTQITSDVSQQGQYAMSIISNTIINSLGLFSATDYSGNPPYTGSSLNCSKTLADIPPGVKGVKMKELVLNDFEAGTTHSLSCDAGPPQTIQRDSLSLIDTDKLEIIYGNSTCYFMCTQPDSFTPPQIEIYFELKQVGTVNFIEQQSVAQMKSSVTLRNYKP